MTTFWKLNSILFLFFCSLNAAYGSTPPPKNQFITIGTGGMTGVYYPTGAAICKLLNKETALHGIRCYAESTQGSVYNLNNIRSGTLPLGIVQSDWQVHAYNGTSSFKQQGPDKQLRSILSLYPEAFTVLARKDAKIENFQQLEGKRVNIGNPGSGQRSTMEQLMSEYGWTKDNFSQTTELKSAEQARALCDNKIDAFVYIVGHPSGAFKHATTSCETTLVTISGDKIAQMIKNNFYYRLISIPGGMYRGNPKDINSFGVTASLVTSANVDDDVIYHITRTIFENLPKLKKMHRALKKLQPSEMIADNLNIPLHEGAKRYFKENNLL